MDKSSNLLARVNVELLLYAGLLLVAAALRVWGLGLRPLSAGEAEHALAAWQLYRGLDYTPRQPLYLLTTLGMFGLFGASDAAARLAPALAGTALVALPVLLRRPLGRVGALMAAALLAVSPGFVFFSDSADGVMLALLAGLLLVAGLWRYLDSARPGDLYLAAVGLGLSWTAGPAAYPIILSVLAFAAVLLASRRGPLPDRPCLIRAGLLGGSALIVAATVALIRLDGLHEVLVNEPGRWLSGLVAPRAVPWEHALRLLVLYDPAAFVLGVMALGYLLAQPAWLVALAPLSLREAGKGAGGESGDARGPFAVFLVLWALVGFLSASLAGDMPASATLPVVLPLILLAGLFLDRLLDEGLAWAGTRGLLVVFALALGYVAVALARLFIWQDQAGSEFTFAACLVIIAIAILYWTWAARPRWIGLAGILIGLLILSFHGATYLIHPPATGPADLLADRPTATDVQLLQRDLDEVAFQHSRTDWAGLEIMVIGPPDPLWGWLLREQRVTFVEQVGESQPRVVIAPVDARRALDEALPGYRRREYTVSTSWIGGPLTWNGYVEWLLYRHSDVPPEKHEFVIYIRP